ncbi:MAG: YkgJ family cysteine cluster protein [Bdellovibrio sp.]|nr:YkgJ family cysteine cluster protein [Bdellovibrio sp.]
MIYTRILKTIFSNYQQTLTTEEYDSFVDFVHGMMIQMMRDLSQFSPGPERARRLQQLIELETDQHAHIKSSCHKGCSACCHLEVEITTDEAALLSEAVDSGYIIDDFRLANLAMREKNDTKWKRGAINDNRCVFLSNEGACSVYDYRPSVCRKALVTSHPVECATELGNVAPIYMPKAEIIISAALNLPENGFGSFAKMLFEQRQAVTLASAEPTVTEA